MKIAREFFLAGFAIKNLIDKRISKTIYELEKSDDFL